MSADVAKMALTTLVLTIAVEDCYQFFVSVKVDNKDWDNKTVQKLQPMAPVAYAADVDAFVLTASAMFRVTDEAEHTIEVTYDDDTTEPQTFTYRIRGVRS